MVDVDVSLDFPVTVSSVIDIGNVPGIDVTKEQGVFGAVFSGEVDTSRSFINPSPKFGVKFGATIEDRNKRAYDTALFGATFEADFTYTEPAPAPQPGLPAGRDIQFHDYFGHPIMPLALLPGALGQRPSVQIVHDFKSRVVRSSTHIEQRQNHFRDPFRTYTFDYVIYPNEQFSILHTLENTDRFPVLVPLFPEMYRFSRPVAAGDQTWWVSTEPEYHLYHAKWLMVFDGVTKWADVYEVGGLQWAETDELSAGSIDVAPGAATPYSPGRYAIFPCMVGWIDDFEPEMVNRKTLTGSLTVREYITGEATCMD